MTQDSDESPNKRQPKKKTIPSKTNKKVKKEDTGDAAFKKKIQYALQANLEQYAKKRNLSQKQISIINSFIEEHLSCFILLGYTVNGDPVSLVNARTQKDSDSLGTLIQKFFQKFIEPPMSPHQPPHY